MNNLNKILSLIIIPIAKAMFLLNVWNIRNDLSKIMEAHSQIKKYNYPNILLKMLILAEDRKYFSHYGIDVIAIFRAFFSTIFGKIQGGSTITQQYLRVILSSYELTLKRKLKEIFLALLLYKKLNKNEVAQNYLTIAYFGTNMIGVAKAASLLKFPINNLTVFQASMIIARLKYPQKNRNKNSIIDLQKRRATYLSVLYKNRYFNWEPHGITSKSTRPREEAAELIF